MARPPKNPSERKSVDLRVPLTEDQKKLIADAAAADQSDVAAWVRPIMLMAAERRLSKETKKPKR